MTEKTAFPIAPHSLKPKQVEIRLLKRNLYIYGEKPYKQTIYIKSLHIYIGFFYRFLLIYVERNLTKRPYT